jgi:hypothetical protein
MAFVRLSRVTVMGHPEKFELKAFGLDEGGRD